VRIFAISRFAYFSCAVFSSAPVADWKRRLKSSLRLSASRRASSSSVRSRRSLAFKDVSLPAHELRLDRQLLAGEAERLLGERLVHARELEHDPARLDDGDPALGRALALAHARLGRLLRVRLVGEDVDPDLAAALDLAGHRDPRRLDLPVADPPVLERLDPEVAELHRRLTLGQSGAAAPVRLAELGLPRHQHYSVAFFLVVVRLARGFGFSRAGGAGGAASGSVTGLSTPAASGGCATTVGSSGAASGWTSCGAASRRGGRRAPPG